MTIFDLGDFKESLETLANGGKADIFHLGNFSKEVSIDVGREGLKLIADIEAHDGIVDPSMFWKWDDLHGTNFTMKMTHFRNWYTTHYGFVIPTQKFIDGLSLSGLVTRRSCPC